MFTPNDIEARLRQQPFVPFRIATSSGQLFEVRHPELVIIGQNWLVVGVPSIENPKFAQAMSQIALMHVTALENIQIPGSVAGNGQP